MSKSKRSPWVPRYFMTDSSLEYSMRLTASRPITSLRASTRSKFCNSLPAAFMEGSSCALIGLLAHFFIAFAVAAIYVGATRCLPMLSRDAVMWGTIYGALVFIVMNFVVLPHTAVVKSPLSLPLFAERGSRARFVRCLPIALAARRITNQSSFSTQAA
jgi:uncharacterized membrane protein YagU involved in acid resistance